MPCLVFPSVQTVQLSLQSSFNFPLSVGNSIIMSSKFNCLIPFLFSNSINSSKTVYMLKLLRVFCLSRVVKIF